MHVAHVVHVFYPQAVGDPFGSWELSLRQVGMGHRISVVTWNRLKLALSVEKVRPGMKVWRLEGINLALEPLLSEYPYLPALPRVLKAIDPDLIHSYSHLFLTTLAATKAARSLGKPSVVAVHGVMARRGRGINAVQQVYLHTLATRVLKEATLVTCLTRSDARGIAALSCPPEKIRVVPNAIDLQLFKPSEGTEEENTVVWLGRFVPEKGLECLIHAARILMNEEPKARFLLVGEGPLKSKVASMVDNLGLHDNVILTPSVDHAIVPLMLARASVFAFPSLSEGLPFALLEAMACAKAVVASNIPGNMELVRHGENGLLFRVGSPADLAEKISMLLLDSKLRRRLGQEARRTAEERCSWGSVLAKTERVYEEARSFAKGAGSGLPLTTVAARKSVGGAGGRIAGTRQRLAESLQAEPRRRKRGESVCVIVPAKNEEETLRACLDSVRGQSRRVDKVIVVDDGSTDGTFQVATSKADLVLRNPGSAGKSVCVQRALVYVDEDVVVVLDADTVVDPRFVEEIVRNGIEQGAVAGSGFVNAVAADPKLSFDFSRRSAFKKKDPVGTWGFFGCCMFFESSLLKKLGYRSATVAEDADIFWRLRSLGYELRLVRTALAHTYLPSSSSKYRGSLLRTYLGFYQLVAKYGWRVLDRRMLASRIGNFALGDLPIALEAFLRFVLRRGIRW